MSDVAEHIASTFRSRFAHFRAGPKGRRQGGEFAWGEEEEGADGDEEDAESFADAAEEQPKVRNGMIHLTFNLRKNEVKFDDEAEVGVELKARSPPREYEPLICLANNSIDLDAIELLVEDAYMSWLYNLLGAIFAGLIREYLVQALGAMVQRNAGELLQMLNTHMQRGNWPLLLKIADITVDEMPEVRPGVDIFTSNASTEVLDIEVLFKKPVVLGLEVRLDESDFQVYLHRISPQSQAEEYCNEHGIPLQALAESTITAINGWQFNPKLAPEARMQECLKGLLNRRRPLAVNFKLKPGALYEARQAPPGTSDPLDKTRRKSYVGSPMSRDQVENEKLNDPLVIKVDIHCKNHNKCLYYNDAHKTGEVHDAYKTTGNPVLDFGSSLSVHT
eukprot:gene6162-7390_t